ncbi:LysR family transcriptional regulator [Salinisphaera sp. Q1T1-3]|uniref:LysR family transcriptional regulator n=1 Tax=Salinisphaera sp. Q1T1-3 TaxID=2321229 RepID=UPI000E71D47D|nr:LysR family transcriptional regulator [Salinisphaera sp. Q1T1-3]RJS93509.1 LysR family transcriptional regulator [Salinisphaera sp. Q1T1-3]
MDRLRAMSLLIAVAEAGNLSAAARRLGMPLSTVHRQIGDLETHLGSRLLNRTTRHTELTEAGAAYVAACRRILEQVDDAERAVRGEYAAPRGSLVMTAPIVFGRVHVVPLITDFMRVYPEIDIRLMLVDRLVHLMDEHVDIALRIGALADSAMVAVPVGRIGRVCCASPTYLAASGRPGHPRDLAEHQCIAMGAPNERHAWGFNDAGQGVTEAIAPRLTITTAEGVIAAAEQGSGIARVLSYQIADAVAARRLETVLESFEPPTWPASLIHTGQTPIPQKTRALIDFLKPRLRERLRASPT